MLPFRKILVPIDYSERCLAIAPYVTEMARHFSGEVTLIHAYGPEALAYSPLPITDPRLPEEAKRLEEQRLRRFAERMFPGQRVETIAELGEAGSVVEQAVQRHGADLVMLATHGRGPVRRFLLGSVAAKVLHDASAAVWTGSRSVFEGHAPRIPYKSILCAIDDTDEAEAAVQAAAAFARGYQARLWLVHIVETPAALKVDFTPYRRALMDSADARLRELKGRLEIDAPHAAVEADVAEGIRQEAARREADLIVTGRGRAQERFSTMLSRLYSIVRESPCPVLSI